MSTEAKSRGNVKHGEYQIWQEVKLKCLIKMLETYLRVLQELSESLGRNCGNEGSLNQ